MTIKTYVHVTSINTHSVQLFWTKIFNFF